MATPLAIASPEEEQPTTYAIAPLGDGWTVVSPDAMTFIAPRTPWTLTDAGVVRFGLLSEAAHPRQFTWRTV